MVGSLAEARWSAQPSGIAQFTNIERLQQDWPSLVAVGSYIHVCEDLGEHLLRSSSTNSVSAVKDLGDLVSVRPLFLEIPSPNGHDGSCQYPLAVRDWPQFSVCHWLVPSRMGATQCARRWLSQRRASPSGA